MVEPAIPVMRFSRIISSSLESMLVAGGVLRPIIESALADPRLDVQLRSTSANPSGPTWATVYLGLTSILDVIELKGNVRFRAADTHKKMGKFDESWSSSREATSSLCNDVVAYIERLLSNANLSSSYTQREGGIQTAIARRPTQHFGMVQREALPSFPSKATRDRFVDQLTAPTIRQLALVTPAPTWWPVEALDTTESESRSSPSARLRGRTGLETDLVGIDDRGRMLVVEVKPASSAQGVVWAPGQLRLYSEVFAAWSLSDATAVASLNAMADQRERLGLPVAPHRARSPLRIAPVIAIGPKQASQRVMNRMSMIHQHLIAAVSPYAQLIEPVELWQFDSKGNRESVTRLSEMSVGHPT